MTPHGPAAVAAVAHTYVERLDDEITIGGTDGHHLQRVRRLRPDETVTAADGHGRWRAYHVVSSDRGELVLSATTGLEHEPALAPRLAVACALTKGERPELVVQKLTELAVDRILFVEAARSVVRWDDTRADQAMTRLARVAREAGAQSRRARIPVVEGPVSTNEIAGHPGLVVAAIEGGDAAALALPTDGPAPLGEWLVAVGPEGGFDPAELHGFGDAPRLGLGPHVLRAETAAIAAAVALGGRRTPVTADDRLGGIREDSPLQKVPKVTAGERRE
jgi:16S rRNA (uracil1498-N3)-methyltransferase